MKQQLETIRNCVEGINFKNIWTMSTSEQKLVNNDFLIPPQLLEDVLDYWASLWCNPVVNHKDNAGGKVERMHRASEWLRQADDHSLCVEPTEEQPNPTNRRCGLQLFGYLIYRYYFGDLRNMIYWGERGEIKLKKNVRAEKKRENSKEHPHHPIMETLPEYQAITLALQLISNMLFNQQRFSPSEVLLTVISTLGRFGQSLENKKPRTVEELASKALRPSTFGI
jgi:hypothetical protein